MRGPGDPVVFHAGTRSDGEDVLTNGGRVLCVTALGDGLDAARENAYGATDKISWNGMFCRRDIGLPRKGGLGAHETLFVGEQQRRLVHDSRQW